MSLSPLAPENFAPYPVQNRQGVTTIGGKLTTVSARFFADKIMITITQDGRLAQWIQVPLDAPNPGFAEQHLPSSREDSLLPMTHLSPKTLLGASTGDRETIGQLYATQIASNIITKNPDEKRTLLVGIGLSDFRAMSDFEANRHVFYDTIDLVESCLK